MPRRCPRARVGSTRAGGLAGAFGEVGLELTNYGRSALPGTKDPRGGGGCTKRSAARAGALRPGVDWADWRSLDHDSVLSLARAQCRHRAGLPWVGWECCCVFCCAAADRRGRSCEACAASTLSMSWAVAACRGSSVPVSTCLPFLFLRTPATPSPLAQPHALHSWHRRLPHRTAPHHQPPPARPSYLAASLPPAAAARSSPPPRPTHTPRRPGRTLAADGSTSRACSSRVVRPPRSPIAQATRHSSRRICPSRPLLRLHVDTILH